MTAKELDLEALDEVMTYVSSKALEYENTNFKKLAKAYLRIWTRLQKVYIRTDASLNNVEGNA